jgi:hypothetical protein
MSNQKIFCYLCEKLLSSPIWLGSHEDEDAVMPYDQDCAYSAAKFDLDLRKHPVDFKKAKKTKMELQKTPEGRQLINEMNDIKKSLDEDPMDLYHYLLRKKSEVPKWYTPEEYVKAYENGQI